MCIHTYKRIHRVEMEENGLYNLKIRYLVLFDAN